MKKISGIITILVLAIILVSCQKKPLPEVINYTVTFDSDGGSLVVSQVVKINELAVEPDEPTKDNYKFGYWDLEGEKFNFDTPITTDITLVAVWEEDVEPINKYIVSFDSNGGSFIADIEVFENDLATKPNEPSRDNYDFIHWELDGIVFDFNTPITTDITLVAVWQIHQVPPTLEFNVTFVLNNGEDDITQTIVEGEKIVLPNITYQGFHLVGWYLDDSFTIEFNEDDIISSDLTLYTRWAIKETVQMVFDDNVWRNEMSDASGFNNAAYVGLEPNYFIVQSRKGTTNRNVGVFGELRFYAGSSMIITMHEAFVISSVRLINSNPNIVVLINNQVVSDTTNINTQAFTVKNQVTSGSYIAVGNVEITYYQIGIPPVKEDDIKRPIFDLEGNDLMQLELGQTFEIPTLVAIDEEEGQISATQDVNKTPAPNPNLPGVYYLHFYAIDSDENMGTIYITIIYRDVNAVANYYGNAKDGIGQNLINSLGQQSLTNFDDQGYDYVRGALGIIDRNPTNFDNVLLIYNRGSVSGIWDGGSSWNREHVWPQSYLGVASDSDMHNIRAASTSINSSRGNKQFANGSGSYGDVSGNWYPSDEDKGDVARIILYMAITWNIQPRESISMLIQWHEEDSVDNFEIIRNEVIFLKQNNRNPFIDYPELVQLAFGG